MTTEMVQAATPPSNGALATKGKDTDAHSAPDAATNGGVAAATAGAPAEARTDGPIPSAPENGSKPATDGPLSAQKATEAGTPEVHEAEEQRKREDELAAKGAEIAGVRALLSRAFNKPSEEPARPKSHWAYLLEELAWLAVDFSQERLWRRTAAFAIAYEIAKKKGEFGLKQPPKEFRIYSDEIRELRAAASTKGEGGNTPPAAAGTGRRSARKGSDAPASGPTLASFLQLDSANDPIFAEFEIAAAAFAENKNEKGGSTGDGSTAAAAAAAFMPGTPPTEEELASALAFPCDSEFAEALEKSLMASDVDRLIQEETVYRSYRLEYEASVRSHQLAVQEQLKQANTIFDLGLGPGFGGEAEEPDAFGAAAMKKAGKRRKGGVRTSGAGGFLGLDDYGGVGADDGDEYGVGSKRNASKAALVEDVYLRKKKPTRTPAYRDNDADYDYVQEGGSRYSTRRATGALARQARAQQERTTRRGAGGRADAYQQQQAARARQHQGAPGMMVWRKEEDDLLLAVVHEFGVNWTLVSEVLSLSLSMQGIHRPPQQCRQRFRHLTMQEGHDYSEERAYAALAQQLSKQQARELLVGSLPVRDDALVRLLEALAQVGAAAANKRAMDDKRNEALRTRRQEMHPSYMAIMTAVMQRSGGRHMSPLELCASVNNAYMEQAARQQAMMAQQAQQAQQAAVMQAQQAAAAAAQHGQHGQPQPPQGAAGQPGNPQVGQQGAPGQPGAPPGGQQQQGLAQGTPAGPHPLGLPAVSPSGQVPPGGGMPPQAQGMPPGAKPPGTATPSAQVTLQQLNAILQTNRLPNGQELDDKMRSAIEGKRAAFLTQIQQQQRLAAAQGGVGAAAPGGASPAAVAAMQASQQQQLAAMQAAQAGGRPPMPPGMYGLLPGTAGGQAVQLPPGAVQQMQPGQLPPGAAAGVAGQQQQLLAQQMMAQQQAAAAAQAQQQQK